MNLIRTAGRWMLASYFIVNGAKQITNPKPLVESADPIVDRFIPLARSIAPAQVAGFIPNRTETMVRLDGGLLALGGLGLGTGIGRRMGAGMIAVAMLPHVLAVNPNGGTNGLDKDENRKHFVRNLALLGSALVASQDTQGKPSLGWRAGDLTSRLAKETDKKVAAIGAGAEAVSKSAQKKLAKAQHNAEKRARKLQRQAVKKADQLLP